MTTNEVKTLKTLVFGSIALVLVAYISVNYGNDDRLEIALKEHTPIVCNGKKYYLENYEIFKYDSDYIVNNNTGQLFLLSTCRSAMDF